MISEEKIRLMTALVRFEQKEGKEDLKSSVYYKNDFVRLNLMKVLISYTVAYLLVLGMIALYYLEDLIGQILLIHFRSVLMIILAIYLVLMGICCFVSVWYYSHVYDKSCKGLKKHSYYLQKMREYYKKSKENTTSII